MPYWAIPTNPFDQRGRAQRVSRSTGMAQRVPGVWYGSQRSSGIWCVERQRILPTILVSSWVVSRAEQFDQPVFLQQEPLGDGTGVTGRSDATTNLLRGYLCATTEARPISHAENWLCAEDLLQGHRQGITISKVQDRSGVTRHNRA